VLIAAYLNREIGVAPYSLNLMFASKSLLNSSSMKSSDFVHPARLATLACGASLHPSL